jgi:hypothetical protein
LEPITTTEGTIKLDQGINKDCTGNKKLVHETNDDYREEEN